MLPLLSSTSTALTLSSEIVSSDTLQIFAYSVIGGIILGIFIGLVVKATWWIWK